MFANTSADADLIVPDRPKHSDQVLLGDELCVRRADKTTGFKILDSERVFQVPLNRIVADRLDHSAVVDQSTEQARSLLARRSSDGNRRIGFSNVHRRFGLRQRGVKRMLTGVVDGINARAVGSGYQSGTQRCMWNSRLDLAQGRAASIYSRCGRQAPLEVRHRLPWQVEVLEPGQDLGQDDAEI